MAADRGIAPLLRVTDLTKRHGDERVVDRVTFSASAGEVVGIIGPDGAGKTRWGQPIDRTAVIPMFANEKAK